MTVPHQTRVRFLDPGDSGFVRFHHMNRIDYASSRNSDPVRPLGRPVPTTSPRVVRRPVAARPVAIQPVALVPLALVLVALLLPGCGSDTTDPGPPTPEPYVLEVPESFPPMRVPPDKPLTVQGVELGRKLFYDPILSRDRTQACGSCHAPEFAFTDHGLALSEGIHGELGTRSAPSLVNAGWLRTPFWDGRTTSLEDQARHPVPNPIEMDLPWDEALPRLREHSDYPGLFEAAFGSTEISEDLVVDAIAQFERTLISGNSKYDQRQRGEVEFTDSEERGFELFFAESGDCFHCHGNVLFTTDDFRDIGLELDPAAADSGRALVTGLAEDVGKFHVPTLRNIEYTAPYMHDGRYATLEDVVRHYEQHVQRSPNLDVLIQARLDRIDRGQRLTDQDILDIVAFLETLSDPEFVSNPDFADPNR